MAFSSMSNSAEEPHLSESSVRSRSLSTLDINAEGLPNEEKNGDKQKNEADLTPFVLSWSFGLNKSVSPINLTMPNYPVMLYASSHAGVLYNYKENNMKLLQGHQNEVVSISADAQGKWVMTADRGDDSAVIVWDAEACTPICTLFSNEEMKLAGISPDAKYLVIVNGEEALNIGLWLWTYGKDTPNDALILEDFTGDVKEIIFNLEDTSQFMLIVENNIVFIKWTTALDAFIPDNTQNTYCITAGTYLFGTHQVLTSTAQGSVLIWSDVPYVKSYQPGATSHKKNFIKKIHLEHRAITTIKSINEIVATGNEKGEIKFYDKHLLLLHAYQDFKLSPIQAISFNIIPESRRASTSEVYVLNNEKAAKDEKRMDIARNVKLFANCEDKTNAPLSACITGRNTFLSRDFIVFTSVGEALYVDVIKNTCELLLEALHGNVTAMDVDPLRPLICLGTSEGDLYLFNYNTKEMLIHTKLTQEIQNIDQNKNNKNESLPNECKGISCLKYSFTGFTLVCGMKNGFLWFLDSTLLNPTHKIPYDHVSASVYKIVFSKDSKCLAHIDAGMRVAAYHCEEMATNQWTFMGKHCPHYKRIVDITFNAPSGVAQGPEEYILYTLGEDRMLIEYDISSSDGIELAVVSKVKIEQSALPLCMTWFPVSEKEMLLLVATDDFKYKLYDSCRTCIRTILGPTFGSPIHMIKVVHHKEPLAQYLIFACGKNLGIQMLPLDGNPYKMMGIVGHHSMLEHFIVDLQGQYIFTCGRSDCSVLMWFIKYRSVTIQTHIGGEQLNPYFCLIEGGQNGQLFQDLRDFFYYAQILHEGENLRTTRQVSDKISLCEIPDLLRAVGFYPSEEEVANILNEVSYANTGKTGHLNLSLNFEDFVKLYINHRPAFGVPSEAIKQAFNVFAHTISINESLISKENLLSALQRDGEPISKEQLKTYMKVLTSYEEQEENNKDRDVEKSEYEGHDEFSFLPQSGYNTLQDHKHKEEYFRMIGYSLHS